MCGIFGYLSKRPLELGLALRVLKLLEEDQSPGEDSPVGGDGCGIAYLNENVQFVLEKVGKRKGHSPADDLERKLDAVLKSSVILGHVRHASERFEDTVGFRECAQPCSVSCFRRLTVICAHNGFYKEYKQTREKLGYAHRFESECANRLTDSEVVAHLFEESVNQNGGDLCTGFNYFKEILGRNNTVGIIVPRNEKMQVFIAHTGQTRGFVLWNNKLGDIIFCSREEPVTKVLSNILSEGIFIKKKKILWNQTVVWNDNFTFTI